MKKKNLVLTAVAVSIASLALLAGCNADKPTSAEATTEPQTQLAAAESVAELSGITPDSAIDIALKDAGVERDKAVFAGSPLLDEDDDKAHYDILFQSGEIEYDYEIALDSGEILSAEKEKAETEKAEPKTEKSTQAKAESSTAKKQNSGYISVDEAKEKALAAAGVKAKDAVFTKAYYDADDSLAHFDIEFVTSGKKYEYEIKAADGSVIEYEIKAADGSVIEYEIEKATDKNYITEAKAKSVALAHAGLKESQVTALKAELELDDVIVNYEVEFVSGKYEYDYKINAKTGKIITNSKEIND